MENKSVDKIKTAVYSEAYDDLSDYGKGIHPDIREEIFTRFSKISDKSGGTGLGLFIVKKLIDRYKGKIWVESRDETNYKKGSTFKIEMNLA